MIAGVQAPQFPLDEGWQASSQAPVHNQSKKAQIHRLYDLIGKYWNLAYKEGAENRQQDTEDGDGARAWNEITEALWELVYPEAPQAPAPAPVVLLPDEALRLAAERTRDDLGPTGDNYPAVRKLLDFVERAIQFGLVQAPEVKP